MSITGCIDIQILTNMSVSTGIELADKQWKKVD